MVTYNLISAAICAIIAIIMLEYDAHKNGIEVNGEQYLPTRFRWFATIGNVFGLSAALLIIKAFEVCAGQQ